MNMLGVRGHDHVIERFRRATKRNRLGNAYLLVGPSGIGKRLLARRLAQAWLCTGDQASLEPCGRCPACRQVLAETHPDLEIVRCPEGQAVLPLERLIGDREHRMQEGLCHWIALHPMIGPRKIAILEDADLLTPEGANALLKTLEEPPEHSMLLLVSHNLQRQLPTIRSRCQVVHLGPLPVDALTEIILEQGIASDPDAARKLALRSAGSIEQARDLADPAWESFASRLAEQLLADPLDPIQASADVLAFVEEAGSGNRERRLRLQHVVRFAIEEFRRAVREAWRDRSSNETTVSAGEHLSETWERRLDRTCAVEPQLDANAHLATLIDAWMQDLAEGRVRLR